MTTATELYSKINTTGCLFNVRREKMVTESGATSKKYGIVNDTTNEVVGIVSAGYKVVTNNQVIEAMFGAFTAAKTDLTDARVDVKHNAGGSRTMVNIILPAYSVLEGKNRTELQISTLNSYDGAWKYLSKCGGIRMACLNGNIFGKIVSSYSEYHNSKLDVNIGAERMSKMIQDFSDSEEWFTYLMGKEVHASSVPQLAAKFFRMEVKDLADYRPYTKLKLLVDAYFTEMGSNAYALYNAFTDYITHKKRSPVAAATSQVFEETQLRHLLDSSKVFAQ